MRQKAYIPIDTTGSNSSAADRRKKREFLAKQERERAKLHFLYLNAILLLGLSLWLGFSGLSLDTLLISP